MVTGDSLQVDIIIAEGVLNHLEMESLITSLALLATGMLTIQEALLMRDTDVSTSSKINREVRDI